MLSGELKQILVEKVNEFLAGHQQRREQLRGDMGRFMWGGSDWS